MIRFKFGLVFSPEWRYEPSKYRLHNQNSSRKRYYHGCEYKMITNSEKNPLAKKFLLSIAVWDWWKGISLKIEIKEK